MTTFARAIVVATTFVETIIVETNIVPTRKTRFEEKVPIDNRAGPETPRVSWVTEGRGEVAMPPVVERSIRNFLP